MHDPATLTLEPFTAADISRLLTWVTTEEFLMQWAGTTFTFPLTEDQLHRHLGHAGGSRPMLLVFRVRSGTQIIGHAELGAIDWRNLSAVAMRILVGDSSARGQGRGELIVHELLRIAFDDLHLHRVSLNVFESNVPALRCYEKSGFRTEGTLREARRLGDRFLDVRIMAILRQEWHRRKPSTAG